MVEAVLLDIDGTLIDNNLLHVVAWQRAFRRIGREIDGSTLLHKIGMGGDKLPPAVLGPEGGSEAEQVAGFHGEEYSEKGLIEHSEPLPGAADLLKALRERGIRVALASSGKGEEVDVYLQHLGGKGAVDAIVTSAEVSGTKPSPDIFATAMEKLGQPSSAVAIADTVYDVESAAKLGVPCICVLSGGIERELLAEAGAAGIYANAADVLANLDAVLSPPDLSEIALGSS